MDSSTELYAIEDMLYEARHHAERAMGVALSLAVEDNIMALMDYIDRAHDKVHGLIYDFENEEN